MIKRIPGAFVFLKYANNCVYRGFWHLKKVNPEGMVPTGFFIALNISKSA